MFDEDVVSSHITVKELRAINCAVDIFADNLRGGLLQLFCDNMPGV